MLRAICQALSVCGISSTLLLASAAVAEPNSPTPVPSHAPTDSPAEHAPSATLTVETGRPGEEVEISWLDEWRDPAEKEVEAYSPAFDLPAQLTFSGRQYTGSVRLKEAAKPGQASARVVSHGGQATKKARFWIDPPATPVPGGGPSTPWLTAGGAAVAAVVLASGVGVLVVRRRRRAG